MSGRHRDMKAEQFKAIRIKAGYSQVTLAKHLGLSERQVSGMECGERVITKRTISQMASLKASTGKKPNGSASPVGVW